MNKTINTSKKNQLLTFLERMQDRRKRHSEEIEHSVDPYKRRCTN